MMLSYPEARLLELVASYDDDLDGTSNSAMKGTISVEESGTFKPVCVIIDQYSS